MEWVKGPKMEVERGFRFWDFGFGVELISKSFSTYSVILVANVLCCK